MDPINECDYINASWITKADPPKVISDHLKHSPSRISFFASQGPLPHTVSHHLQMIEEQRPCVVVMVTKLEERVNNGEY